MPGLRAKLNDFLKITDYTMHYEFSNGFLLDFTFQKTNFPHMIGLHKLKDINIIQKYAPKIKIEIFGGITNYKFANQILTGGADIIGSDQGYEIVKRYKDLRENTQVTPKPITL